MRNDITNFNKLSYSQKVNYIKNLLFNNGLNETLNILLKYEKKDLKVIKIIINAINEDIILDTIKKDCNLTDLDSVKLFVYSKILSILFFYQKKVLLNNLFKSLSPDELKKIAINEYKNKTTVSSECKIFEKFCSKYKELALDELKANDEEILMLTMEMQRYNMISDENSFNKPKGKFLKYVVIVGIILFILIFIRLYSDLKLVNSYKGLFYPGIYLDNVSLGKNKISDIDIILKNEKKKLENGTILITSNNGDYKFSYKELGISVNDNYIKDKIKNYNNNLSIFEKIMMVRSNKRVKTFYLNGSFDSLSIDNFMIKLEEKLNVSKRSDGLVIDENNNVYYDKGVDGFILDTNKTKLLVEEALLNLQDETVIEAKGEAIKTDIKNEFLSGINKKISTYTTYFSNSGNRGHNITLASSRLNSTIIMPGETFSYLKVVGPYGASNGYLPAPIYLNGTSATANGGGVCQLASTLYNAQLKAGLETVSRRGHTFAPTYVPKGLDATVYSTTTDYKFKNNYKHPIYIVSYVKGNYLTVDIWSNENTLDGKTYEPYSVYSNNGYLAYLKVIKDGNVIETKYLDKSYYKTH